MKQKKFIQLILIFLILIQNIVLEGCNLPTQLNSPGKPALLNQNSFTKKSVPDEEICSQSNLINFSVSKYKIIPSSGVAGDTSLTITTNIPAKYDNLKSAMYSHDQRQISYVLKITRAGYPNNLYEKILTSGCTSFDWDGKDSNGIPLELGTYNVNIYFKIKLADNSQSYLTATEFQSDIPYGYCDNVLQENNTTYHESYGDNLYYGVSCSTYTSFSSPNEVKKSSDTTIEIAEAPPEPLPPDTKFFEPEDLKTLSDYAADLEISTNDIETLYEKVKEIDMLLDQKRSWETRRNTNTAKVTELNNKIAAVNSQLSGWQAGVMGQLSNLSYKNDILTAHINTITEQDYIVPYPPEEKPDSVGSYSDKAYFADQDVSNILQDGVTLYAPDENDSNQDNLKDIWEVDPERVEVLDPTQVFDGSKYVSNEIQTTKDLLTDYLNGNFNDSGTEGTPENTEAIGTLRDSIIQIKTHIGYLQTQAKKLIDDQNINAIKVSADIEALKAYFVLKVAEVNNKLEGNDTFLLQALTENLNKNNFSIKTGEGTYFYDPSYKLRQLGGHGIVFTFDDFRKAIIKHGGFVLGIVTAETPYQEYQAMKILGYTQEEWDAIKLVDDGVTTRALVKATLEMANALGYPIHYYELVPFAGKFLQGLKLLKHINVHNIKEFVAEAKVVKNYSVNFTESLKKFVKKNPPKDCFKKASISTLSFHYQSFNTKVSFIDCPHFLEKVTEFVIKGNQNKNLMKWYKENNKIFPRAKVLENINAKDGLLKFQKAWIKYNKLPNTNIEKQMIFKIRDSIATLESYGGIPIRKIKGKDIYTPDMRPFKIFDEVKLTENTVIGGRKTMIGGSDDYISASQVLYYKNTELRNAFASPEKMQAFFNKIGVTWHHVEDLNTMILVPTGVHAGMGHFGASSLIKNLKDYLYNWHLMIQLGYE